MAENGYGPVAGHIGRIPNYGKTQVNPMGNVEPPACIQNAMMTKDKKPFTYTPGGLDLSQIRSPSIARRMAKQRSIEEQDQAYGQQQPNGGGNYQPQGGPAPPPPPPQAPAPPPPPPLVIEVSKSKSPNPIVPGVRPEIVIPDNPIGMLRKTNSPYHWEAEKADRDRMGPVPKFVEKIPSPLTVQMPTSQQPPSAFSQQPPQSYTPQAPNNIQRQNYQFVSQNSPQSPVHRPEAQYANQKPSSPNISTSVPTREMLQRQDSQFNKSPQPFSGQSPVSNGTPFSPTPNNNWKQPERRDSPASNVNNSPQTPPFNRPTFAQNTRQYSPAHQGQSPPVNSGYHTLPRAGPKVQDNLTNNVIFNNTRDTRQQSPKIDVSNPTPWRTNTLNRQSRDLDNHQSVYNNNQNTGEQQAYNPPWKTNENQRVDNNHNAPWKQENRNQVGSPPQPAQQYNPPWARSQDTHNNSIPQRPQYDNTNRTPAPFIQNQPQEQPRYQSTMSIPVTSKKPAPQEFNNASTQRDVVYVNQEPVYYCPDSPKSVPPFVKKEKTKTPPPEWVQKSLEGRRSAPRELVTPPRDANQEPEWVRKSNEMQRNARELVSPPKYSQPVQPTWSTRPSENRKSVPRDNTPTSQGNRFIPVQTGDQSWQGNQQPQMRITIDMPGNPNVQNQSRLQAPYSQPTQRIMRVLSPQLVRLDDTPIQQDLLPSLNTSFQSNQDNQPKTRIIPIQIEGASSGANKSFGGRY